MANGLTPERAQALAEIVLGHVTRAYPHKLDHILTGPIEDVSPERLHPVFFGSFDWHSCVHGYWSLARLVRRFPSIAAAPAITALLDRQVTPGKVAVELAYSNAHPRAASSAPMAGPGCSCSRPNSVGIEPAHGPRPCGRSLR